MPGKVDRDQCLPKVRLIRRSGAMSVWEVSAHSTLWKSKKTIFEFRRDRIEVYHRIRGKGSIDRAHFFRGALGKKELGSIPGFEYVRCGQANFLNAEETHASMPVSIGVSNDLQYWGYALSGGPLYYAFANAARKKWLGVCCVAAPGDYGFDRFEFNYRPPNVESYHDAVVNTQSFSLRYLGHQKVVGEWVSPRMVLVLDNDERGIARQYNALLERNGTLRRVRAAKPAWWRRPIFCGWHEQVAAAVQTESGLKELESSRRCMAECTQANYTRYLHELSDNGITPGTVIIDATWSGPGTFMVADPEKWPDLRGFCEACHARNQRVLLWLNAWTWEGVPANECIRDGQGNPVAVDASNPRFRERVRRACRKILGAGPGCYDADGLKMDGTNSTPAGYDLSNHGNIWGFEFLRLYLQTWYSAAKAAKKDALVSTFCANPYFNDVSDMVRLGDLYTTTGDPISRALRNKFLYEASMPDSLIDTDSLVRWTVTDDYAKTFALLPKLGIPCLYTSRLLMRQRPFSIVQLSELTGEDYRAIRKAFGKASAPPVARRQRRGKESP